MSMENHGEMISTDLSGNPTSSHLVAKEEELVKEMMNVALQTIFVHTSKSSLTK
jgi:hypothetical protein